MQAQHHDSYELVGSALAKSHGLRYFCDDARHLVCWPYSVENLHLMAADLGIKRCWFHSKASYPHYDIPKRRTTEILAQCTVVSSRDILSIVKGTYSRDTTLQWGPEVLDDGQKNSTAPEGDH
jgi:hypothetical protein